MQFNENTLKVLYDVLRKFANRYGISTPEIADSDLHNFSIQQLFAIFDENLSRENIPWQKFYEYFLDEYADDAERKVNDTTLKSAVEEFLVENKVEFHVPTSNEKINQKTLRRFDFFLYDTFNKPTADRLLLYVKALYLEKYLDLDPEAFVQTSLLEMQGTLLELLKDTKDISEEEKKLRRILSEALYEIFPDKQQGLEQTNVLTPEERLKVLAPAEEATFYETDDNLIKFADELIERKVNSLPIEFPYNEYKVGNEMLSPEHSLAMDKWMRVSGIVDENGTIHPELLFTNLNTPVNENLSKILRKAALKSIYRHGIKQELSAAFKSSPAGVDPMLSETLAQAFSEDLSNKLLKAHEEGRINIFESGLAILGSIFSHGDKDINDYVQYIVDSKLNEAQNNNGIVDQGGMLHEGAGLNRDLNSAVKQTLPGAFKSGMSNAYDRFSDFKPAGTDFSQYNPVGNFNKNGVGSFLTPNIPQLEEGIKLQNAVVNSPINAQPSLSSLVGKSFGGVVSDSEKHAAQKAAFTNPEYFKSANYSNPFSEKSPLKNILPKVAPSSTRFSDFEKDIVGSNLSNNVSRYIKDSTDKGLFSPVAHLANTGIGKLSQKMGGGAFDPNFSPVSNLASTLAYAPSKLIPPQIKNNLVGNVAKREAQQYPQQLQKFNAGKLRQIPQAFSGRGQKAPSVGNAGFPQKLLRGSNAIGNGMTQGAQAGGGAGGYLGVGTAVGAALSSLPATTTGIIMGTSALLPNLLRHYTNFLQTGQTINFNGRLDKVKLIYYLKSYASSSSAAGLSPANLAAIQVAIRELKSRAGENKTNMISYNQRLKRTGLIAANAIAGNVQSYLNAIFGSRDMVNGTIAFVNANLGLTANLLTATRFTALKAARFTPGAGSKMEGFYTMLIGRHADIFRNPAFAGYKKQMDKINKDLYQTKWYEFGKRRELLKAQKGIEKHLSSLGYGAVGIIQKFQGFLIGNNWLSLSNAYNFLNSPGAFIKSKITGKIKSVAGEVAKKAFNEFRLKLATKLIAKFGASALGKLGTFLLGVGTGGIGAVIGVIVFSSKSVLKFLLWFVILFIALICTMLLGDGAFYGSVGTAAKLGHGSSVANEQQTQSDLSLKNEVTDKSRNTIANYLNSLSYGTFFNYKYNSATKPVLNYPGGAIYYIVLPNSVLSRSDYEIEFNGSKLSNTGNSFLMDQKVPINGPETSSYLTNYQIKITFTNAQKTQQFDSKNPFCTAAVYVKDRSKVDPNQNQDLSTIDTAASAVTCVDKEGNQLTGNGTYFCPFNVNETKYCTQGSYGGYSHKTIRAMDIDTTIRAFEVHAPIDGFVNKIYSIPGCGGVIEFKGDDNRRYDFWHVGLESIPWKQGDRVTGGARLARAWQGYANKCWTGQHIHNEVYGDASDAGSHSTQNTKQAYPEDIFPNLLGCKITVEPVNDNSSGGKCRQYLQQFKKN